MRALPQRPSRSAPPPEENTLELSPGISQTEPANILGVHRISLLRVIQKLKRDGVLQKLTKDRLVFTTPEKLRKLAMR